MESWDEPFPWYSAGSEPRQPVAVCSDAFVWRILYATKQLLKPAAMGIKATKVSRVVLLDQMKLLKQS